MCDMSMCMCSAEGIRLAESHWHHRSGKKSQTWFGQANVSNSGVLRQKAASTCLPSVRPDMPHLALVQLSGELRPAFKIVLHCFT